MQREEPNKLLVLFFPQILNGCLKNYSHWVHICVFPREFGCLFVYTQICKTPFVMDWPKNLHRDKAFHTCQPFRNPAVIQPSIHHPQLVEIVALSKTHLSLLYSATKGTRNQTYPSRKKQLDPTKGRDHLLQNQQRGEELSREAGWHGQGGSLSFQHCSLALYRKQGCRISAHSVSSVSRNSTSNIIPG